MQDQDDDLTGVVDADEDEKSEKGDELEKAASLEELGDEELEEDGEDKE